MNYLKMKFQAIVKTQENYKNIGGDDYEEINRSAVD